jgi:hypothetical protein
MLANRSCHALFGEFLLRALFYSPHFEADILFGFPTPASASEAFAASVIQVLGSTISSQSYWAFRFVRHSHPRLEESKRLSLANGQYCCEEVKFPISCLLV